MIKLENLTSSHSLSLTKPNSFGRSEECFGEKLNIQERRYNYVTDPS